MPNEKGNLYLFEAIELRNEYDRHINLLENILYDSDKAGSFLRSSEEEVKEPAKDFHQQEIEDKLKKIQTKRVKLNQAIQESNFTNRIKLDGDEISVAEALEIRKNLLSEIDSLKERIKNSAYKKIIHKEERDIVREPKHSFAEVYNEYTVKLFKYRELVNMIHIANHENEVKFKEE